MAIIGPCVWKALTTKDFEHMVVGFSVEELLVWTEVVDDTRRQSVYEICTGEECIIPEALWHTGLCKQNESNFNDVAVLSLRYAVLFRCVRT